MNAKPLFPPQKLYIFPHHPFVYMVWIWNDTSILFIHFASCDTELLLSETCTNSSMSTVSMSCLLFCLEPSSLLISPFSSANTILCKLTATKNTLELSSHTVIVMKRCWYGIYYFTTMQQWDRLMTCSGCTKCLAQSQLAFAPASLWCLIDGIHNGWIAK